MRDEAGRLLNPELAVDRFSNVAAGRIDQQGFLLAAALPIRSAIAASRSPALW